MKFQEEELIHYIYPQNIVVIYDHTFHLLYDFLYLLSIIQMIVRQIECNYIWKQSIKKLLHFFRFISLYLECLVFELFLGVNSES